MKIFLLRKLRLVTLLSGLFFSFALTEGAYSQCLDPANGNVSQFYTACSDGSSILFQINAKSNIDAPATGPNYGSTCDASNKSFRVNAQWIVFKATDNGNVALNGSITTGNLYLWVWGGFDTKPTDCSQLQTLAHCGQYDHTFSATSFPVVKDKWYVMLASGFKGSDSYFSLSGTGPVAIPPPVVADQTRCGNGPVTFTASGALPGQLYRWYDSNGVLVQSGTSPTYTTPILSTPSTTYKVEIQVLGAQSTNCESAQTTVTASINELPKITSQPVNQTVCEGASASFTVAASGTAITYQWQVDTGAGFTNIADGGIYSGTTSPTLTITGASASNYQYRAVVSGTCLPSVSSNSAYLTVNPSPLAFNVTGGGSYCADDNGKTIGLDGSQIGVRYQLQRNGVSVGSPVDGTGSALDFGIFTDGVYTVTAANTTTVCPATMNGSPLITKLSPITADLVVQPYTCGAPGSIEVQNITGGSGTYTYSIDGINFQAGTTFTIVNAGSYTITIKDAEGCLLTITEIIAPLDPPIDLIFTATPVTCPALTSDVSLSPVKGIGPFNYQITAPAGYTTNVPVANTFQGLPPGTYTFRITDSRGCSYDETYTINPIVPIDVIGKLVGNVSCFDAADGKMLYTVSGFTGTYSYSVDFLSQSTGATTSSILLTGQTSPTISLIGAAGTYTINVKDEVTNCTRSYQVVVQRPATPLVLAATVRPITCFSDPSGSVTASASGGWGGYQYHLQLPGGDVTSKQGSIQFTGLVTAGNYILYVTDANGCEVPFPFTLSIPPKPVLSLDPASDLCFDSNLAKLIVNATNGIAPYTYSINGATPVNSNTFSNLIAGSYSITVTDAYGCKETITQIIEPELVADAVLLKTLDCSATAAATIQVTIRGGYSTYNYQVSVDGGSYGSSVPVTGTTISYSAPTSGTYQFKITDSQGCFDDSNIITVTTPVPPVISQVVQTQFILCNGESTGAFEVKLDPAKGTSQFTYTINDGINPAVSQTSPIFSGLKAGSYQIIVKDAISCESNVFTFVIAEPSALTPTINSTNLSCSGGVNQLGSITVGASGGTAGYTYFLRKSDYSVNVQYAAATGELKTFSGLNFGDYIVRIVDLNGCETIETITITSPPNLIITTTADPSDCLTGGSMTVQASSTNGTLGSGPSCFTC